MQGKLTKQSDLIKKFKIIHNSFYDYLLINYINSKTKIKIICPIHGVFEQNPRLHLNGSGCKKCYYDSLKSNKITFVEKSNKKHNSFYDYSLVDYKNSYTKVKIICPIHGIFKQTPHNHLRLKGCKKCSYEKLSNNKNIFIEKSNIIHSNNYDYSLINYTNAHTKIKIRCNNCKNIFNQTPNKHLMGRGCPKCNVSKGEKTIKNMFEKNNIYFIEQKIFDKCKYIKHLKFDFYLPVYNLCVEYDGLQHFEKYRFEKNDEKLKTRQLRDKTKNKYCEENGIKLLRIKYNEDIKTILNKIIKIK